MSFSTYNIYYLETNIICILMLITVLAIYIGDRKNAADSIHFRIMILDILVYCIVDIIAALCKSMSFTGVRTVLYVSNSIYIAMPIFLVLRWESYAQLRMEQWGYKKTKVGSFVKLILYVVAIVILSTPFTNFAFSLDANNLYHRETGAYFAPFTTWLYVVYVSIKTQRLKKKVDSLSGLNIANAIVMFSVPSILASIIQLFFYGSTVAQVGFTASAWMIFLVNQTNQISRDELTGLNNRRECDKYLYSLENSKDEVLLCMMDVRKFKQINDTYGHVIGDEALQSVAFILKNVCQKVQGNLFVARYGGDEFIIVAREPNEDIQKRLAEELEKELILFKEKGKQYSLRINYGFARGKYSKKLLHVADQEMYKNKQKDMD